MTASRTTRAFRRLYSALALIVVLLSGSPVRGEPPIQQTTARLFKVLRAQCDELHASVSDEEIESSLAGPCDVACLRDLETAHRELVASRGRPVELMLRQRALQDLSISKRDGSAIGSAPCCAPSTDRDRYRNKSIVTRSDVIGMINRLRFGNSNGAPKHDQPSEREVREITSAIDSVLAQRDRLAIDRP